MDEGGKDVFLTMTMSSPELGLVRWLVEFCMMIIDNSCYHILRIFVFTVDTIDVQNTFNFVERNII